jgi:hypothetical protein
LEEKKEVRESKGSTVGGDVYQHHFFFASLTSTGVKGDEMSPKCSVLEGFF